MTNNLTIEEIKMNLISGELSKIKLGLESLAKNKLEPKLFLIELIFNYFKLNISTTFYPTMEETVEAYDLEEQIGAILSKNISAELKQFIENSSNIFETPVDEHRRNTISNERYISAKINEFASTGELDGMAFAHSLIKYQDNFFTNYALWYYMDNKPGTTYLIKEWRKTKNIVILEPLFNDYKISFIDFNLTQEEFEVLFTHIASSNNIDSVEFLNFGSNQIIYLPREIGKFQNLKGLYLADNLLKRLPEEISHLRKLEEFIISDNQLQQLPSCIAHLHNLKMLFVDNNKLIALSEEISQLKNLTNLYLNDNDLEALPEWITELQNLDVLSASNNKLKFLPNAIGQLQFKGVTSYLSLNDNQLKELPASIQQLTHLKELYIRNNFLSDEKISQLKEWLPNCKIYA